MIDELACSKCKEVKTVNDFYDGPTPERNGKINGKKSECKECTKKRARHNYEVRKYYKKRQGVVAASGCCTRCLARLPREGKKTCQECAEKSGIARRANYDPVKSRETVYLKKYGITIADYTRILESQNEKCAICETTDSGHTWGRFVIDHCHETGKVRGLLCFPCNAALGHLKDDPEIMRRAADYVERGGN